MKESHELIAGPSSSTETSDNQNKSWFIEFFDRTMNDEQFIKILEMLLDKPVGEGMSVLAQFSDATIAKGLTSPVTLATLLNQLPETHSAWLDVPQIQNAIKQINAGCHTMSLAIVAIPADNADKLKLFASLMADQLNR